VPSVALRWPRISPRKEIEKNRLIAILQEMAEKKNKKQRKKRQKTLQRAEKVEK